MQVVDQGALKGFVPVNRAWNGFSTDDYKKASLSAYDEDTKHENTNEFHAEQTNKSAFDLSGYEIVRAQFFQQGLIRQSQYLLGRLRLILRV